MKNFRSREGSRGGSRGERDFGGPRRMHQTTCAKCHQACEVPFKPVGDRPVFCSNCFDGQGDSQKQAPRKNYGRDNFGPNNRGSDEVRLKLTEINDKLDQIISVLGKNKS